MALPDFNSNDLIPDGVHTATKADFEQRFVTPFPNSVTRQVIFDGLVRYQADLVALGLDITQWIDGSMVDRSRLDPDDVDLVNFLDESTANAVPPSLQARAADLLDGRDVTKVHYHCHTFLEIVFPHGHQFALMFEQRRQYWRKWWAMPQDYSNPPLKTQAPSRGSKGFVAMTVGNNPASAPNVNTGY
jgi:hypothetical protein